MTVKIGLISDVHATPAPLQEALAVFQREGVDMILCAGDIAGYGAELEQAVGLLIDSRCRAVLGNHDLWWLARDDAEIGGRAEVYLRSLPTVVEFSAEGKQVYMVHASPPESTMEGITLLDESGALIQVQQERWSDFLETVPFDVLVVGHTHQVFAERLGPTLVVNPGSTRFNHSCAILNLPEMELQIFALSGKPVRKAWNWGMERGRR